MNIKRILLSAALSVGMLLSAAGCSGTGSSSGNVEDLTFADGDKIAVIEIKDYGTVKAKLFPDIAPIGVENFIQLAEQGYYNGLKIHRVIKDGVIQGGSLNGDGTGGAAAYVGEVDERMETLPTSFPIEVSEKARHFYGALAYVADEYGNCATQFYIVDNKTPQDLTKIDAAKIQAKADEIAQEAAAATWEADSSDAKANSYLQSYYGNHAKFMSAKDKAVIDKYAKVGGLYQIDGGYTVFGQVFEGFDVIDSISSAEVETNAYGEKSMPVKDIIISSVTIETYSAGTAEAEDDKSSGGKNESKQEDSSAGQATSEAGGTADAAGSGAAEKQTGEAISTIDTVDAAA